MEELLYKWNVPLGMEKNKEIACLMNNMYCIDKRRYLCDEQEVDNYFSGKYYEVLVNNINSIDIKQNFTIWMTLEDDKSVELLKFRKDAMAVELEKIIEAIETIRNYYK